MYSQVSAEYFYLDVALKSLWQPFNELVAEMDLFVPRPLSDYEDERRKMFEQYRKLNPAPSDESLAKRVDDQITFAASDRVQFVDQFSDRFMTQYVTVALLSHALCEAAINAIMAFGLVEHGSKELFTVIEKADIKEKWCVGPKCFCPSYELQRGTALFETLNHLTKRRNALVHNKIHLHVDGKKVLEGSKFERLPFPETIRWMRRFFSLPYDLVAHAHIQIKEHFMLMIFANSPPIVMADEHKTPNH